MAPTKAKSGKLKRTPKHFGQPCSHHQGYKIQNLNKLEV